MQWQIQYFPSVKILLPPLGKILPICQILAICKNIAFPIGQILPNWQTLAICRLDSCSCAARSPFLCQLFVSCTPMFHVRIYKKAGGYLQRGDWCIMWVSSHSRWTVRQMIDAFVVSCMHSNQSLHSLFFATYFLVQHQQCLNACGGRTDACSIRIHSPQTGIPAHCTARNCAVIEILDAPTASWKGTTTCSLHRSDALLLVRSSFNVQY